MGVDFKINEYGEIIREVGSHNDLINYEEALLRGEKVNATIRRKIAKETRNERVLWLCVNDSAISVVVATKANPMLTYEMKSIVSKKEKKWKQLKQYNKQELVENNSENDSVDYGCVRYAILIIFSLSLSFLILFYGIIRLIDQIL